MCNRNAAVFVVQVTLNSAVTHFRHSNFNFLYSVRQMNMEHFRFFLRLHAKQSATQTEPLHQVFLIDFNCIRKVVLTALNAVL